MGILIVDDKPAMRNAVADTLAVFSVTNPLFTAADGRKAVELFREHMDQIDLVLLDMEMPSMDGTATLRQLRALNPQIKVIILSGLSRAQVYIRLGSIPVEGVLHKPFKVRPFLDLVSGALDQPSPVPA